jgi:hypothetical protein
MLLMTRYLATASFRNAGAIYKMKNLKIPQSDRFTKFGSPLCNSFLSLAVYE